MQYTAANGTRDLGSGSGFAGESLLAEYDSEELESSSKSVL